MSETTQQRAERMARLDRDLRRMAVLTRRAAAQQLRRRRGAEVRTRTRHD